MSVENLPSWTRSPESCKYRTADNGCCDGLNFLRWKSCGTHCVRMLEQWLRSERPELNGVGVQLIISSITTKKPRKNNMQG